MKPNYGLLIVILVLLVIVLILYVDIPAFNIPDFDIEFGIGAIGEALSKAFEGIARSIKF